MWKLTYDAPYGRRINRYWWEVTTYPTKSEQRELWWVYSLNKWATHSTGTSSTHHNKPKSIKAFKRYLEKHPELKGYEVVLVNKYYTEDHGFNVSAVWEEIKDA